MSSSSNTLVVRLNPAARRAVVQQYTISGSPVIVGDPSSVLHWRIFVKCAYGDYSCTVKLDLIPGQDGRTGVLMVTTVPYELSSSSAAHVSHHATTPITIDQLLQTLQQRYRDRYMYDDTGSGCRYWCRTVLQDLEVLRLVSAGACQEFDGYVVSWNQQHPARFPLPTRQGTFY
ncbi:hypothetical protein F5I97DRAFT_1898812 [Phlebopus sp. FC_14]|nr:hypothetical protein F5I97DRAFT_1898812 [Phlebopus sp. FC_14]